jgi:hypothetical protein
MAMTVLLGSPALAQTETTGLKTARDWDHGL